MRLIVVLLLFTLTADAYQPYLVNRRKAFRATVAAGGATYLIKQGFEGTGYDNSETWTEAGTGTVDEDYSTSPLAGSQSLQIVISAQTGSTWVGFSAQGELHGFGRIKRNSSSSTVVLFGFRENSSSRVAVHMTSTGAIRIVHGSVTATTTDTVGAGTEAYIWWRGVKATGAGNDGVAEVWWSTDSTKPASSGNKYQSITTGTATADMNRLYIGETANSTMDIIFDHVRVDDVEIGSNPE